MGFSQINGGKTFGAVGRVLDFSHLAVLKAEALLSLLLAWPKQKATLEGFDTRFRDDHAEALRVKSFTFDVWDLGHIMRSCFCRLWRAQSSCTFSSVTDVPPFDHGKS